MKEKLKLGGSRKLLLLASVSLISFIAVLLITLIINIVLPGFKLNLSGSLLFSDFAETISYCVCRNPYSGDYGMHSIYPPFAFLPFYLFALICKNDLIEYLNGNIPLEVMYKQPAFVFSFVLYYIINMAIILYVVYKISKFKGWNLIYLLVTVFCFGPFIYAFGRANVIITAFLFALLFFALYDSEKRWQRELANVFLACSIAVKIYPIVLLLFFIKDRRFLDMLKTLVYSLILLFIPFLLIEQGFGNIKWIWRNFTQFNSGEGRSLNMSNISLDSTCSKIAYAIGKIGGFNSDGLYGILSKLTRFPLLLIAIVLPIFSKKSELKMQNMLICILTYELFQGVSYGYTMLFLIVPMVYFIINYDSFSKKDKWIYGILYGLIAMPLFYVTNFYLVQSIALIALVTKAIVDQIKDDVRIKKTA